MKKLLSSLCAIAMCCVLMALATTVNAQSRSVKVMGENVRLRLGPSTSASVYSFESIPIYPEKGEVLPLLGEAGDWYKVRFNSKELYISKRFAKLSQEKATNLDERIIDYLNQELAEYGQTVARPLTVVGIDLDNDDQPETIAKDANGLLAVFTTVDSLSCIGWFDSAEGVNFYTNRGVFRYYNGVGAGYEEEFYFVLRNSRLTTQYRRKAEPQGDIRTQRNVRVKNSYSKVTYPGRKVEEISEDAFWGYAATLEDETPQKFDEMWDL